MKLFTCLETQRPNWTHIQCVGLQQVYLCPQAESVWDDEERNGLIEEGDRLAVENSLAVLKLHKRHVAPAKVWTYGWPFPRQIAHVKPFAKHFAKLVGASDGLVPCCYVANKDEQPEAAKYRGRLFKQCVGLIPKASRLPRMGAISDWTNATDKLCDESMWKAQIAAAIEAGCKSLYLWSGMHHRYWQITRAVDETSADTLRENVSKARAELLGMWGWDLRDESPKAMALEYERAADRMMATVENVLRTWYPRY